MLSDEYINASTNLDYKCSCGNYAKIKLTNVLRGQKCTDCGNKKRKATKTHSIDYVKEVFRNNGCVFMDNEYLGVDTPHKYRCECGRTSRISLTGLVAGNRCRDCGIEVRSSWHRFSYEYVFNLFEASGCRLLEQDYKNNQQILSYVCSCGNISATRLASFQKGHRCKQCGIQKISGSNSSSYNPSLTEEERNLRVNDRQGRRWAVAVKERDNFKCRVTSCNISVNLVAHHLDGYDKYEEKRYEINNGITLCRDCHIEFHRLYGFGNNTKEQFKEWLSCTKRSVS